VQQETEPMSVAVRSPASHRGRLRGTIHGNDLDLMLQEEFSLQESVWDAAILVHLPSLGVGASMQLLLGLFINLFVQVVFLLIVHGNLAKESLTDPRIKSFEMWRSRIAHDEKYATPFGTLADRVCNLDLSLEMSTEQVTTLSAIRSYLPWLRSNSSLDTWARLTDGRVMCILAISLWTLSAFSCPKADPASSSSMLMTKRHLLSWP